MLRREFIDKFTPLVSSFPPIHTPSKVHAFINYMHLFFERGYPKSHLELQIHNLWLTSLPLDQVLDGPLLVRSLLTCG